jgi:hypothetical protein
VGAAETTKTQGAFEAEAERALMMIACFSPCSPWSTITVSVRRMSISSPTSPNESPARSTLGSWSVDARLPPAAPLRSVPRLIGFSDWPLRPHARVSAAMRERVADGSGSNAGGCATRGGHLLGLQLLSCSSLMLLHMPGSHPVRY